MTSHRDLAMLEWIARERALIAPGLLGRGAWTWADHRMRPELATLAAHLLEGREESAKIAVDRILDDADITGATLSPLIAALASWLRDGPHAAGRRLATALGLRFDSDG